MAASSNTHTRHLWLGNLVTKLQPHQIRKIFEQYGPVEDIKSHPGYRYAFVNFYRPEDAAQAVRCLDNREMPELTGDRPLMIKFRVDKRPLGPMNDVILQNEGPVGAGGLPAEGAV